MGSVKEEWFVAVSFSIGGGISKVDMGREKAGGCCPGFVLAKDRGLSSPNIDMRSFVNGLKGDPGGEGEESTTGECLK